MRRINQCLNANLITICKNAIKLEELNIKVYEYLPESLRDHCQVGSFDKGTLILVVNDPAWAAQLRYTIPELRDKLRQEAGIYQLITIKIKLATKNFAYNEKKSSIPSLSAQARDTLLTAGNKCKYLPLKEAIQNLAREPEK